MFASLGLGSLLAQDKATNDLKEYAERAQNAANVLGEIMGIPEQGIPDELMEHAQGIAVIPHVVKGAFGVGGRYGKGLEMKLFSLRFAGFITGLAL